MGKEGHNLQVTIRGYNDADAGWSAGRIKPHAEPGKVFHPMGILTVQLLGEFGVALDGTPVTTLNTDRLQSLFGYLLVHRRTAVSRQQLAFLFWPDSNEAQARTNLRNLLFTLNRALPNAEEFLSINGTTLQWRTDAPSTLDVDEFEKAASRADSIESLRDAVTAYHGELLPGLYDDWVLAERERLDREYTQTLEKLVDALQAKKEYREAIKYAQQLARHDTLREDTYRRLMQLYALGGDRSGVRRVYEQCQSVLKRELDVEPSRETQQAYQQALRFEPGDANSFAAPASIKPVEPTASAAQPPAMPPPAPIPWYRERSFLQNASYGISIAVPLVLLVILAFVVQMPLIVALGISVVVFAGLFFLLNWQTRVEIERQDIADDIRRKLYDCRVRIAQIRALSVRIQNGDMKQLVEQICRQAEGLLEKLESNKSTSLATTSRFEYILAETRDILEKYVQMTRGGGAKNATLIREIEDELLPLLHKSLGEFAVSLDQNEMIKLEASIRVLEDTLKKEGLN